MTHPDKPEEPLYYYAKGDARFGPVFESDLTRLFALGKIDPSDRIWSQAIGPDWVDAGEVEIFHRAGSTPVQEEVSLWYYLMIASPLIGGVTGLFSLSLAVISGIAAHLVFPVLDVRAVRAAGHRTFSFWMIAVALIFLPAYLFVRAYSTGRSMLVPLLYIAASIVAALLMFFLSGAHDYGLVLTLE